jgi:hypothetical protein
VSRRTLAYWWSALAVPALLAVTLTGCEASAEAAEPTGALAIVVGAHANMPPADLDGTAASARDMAVAQQSYFSVVVADGAPYVAESGGLEAAGDTGLEEQREANRKRVDDAVAAARARTPETDLLAALQVAAASIQAQPGHRRIVVLDSGLSTTGALDFTNPDLLDAVPSEIADALGTSQKLPALDGMSVDFLGLGNTAEPQAELDRIRRTQLQSIWTVVAETAGASSVAVESTSAQGLPAGDLPPVKPVPMPPGYSCTDNVMTITGGKLAFRPYTDVFLDPATAEEILRPVADQVKDGMLTAVLNGTSADIRDPAEQMMLTYFQAQAVANVWLEFDLPVQQLTVVGLGSDFPGHRPERDADGNLDPAVAEANRTITITFSGPVTCS